VLRTYAGHYSVLCAIVWAPLILLALQLLLEHATFGRTALLTAVLTSRFSPAIPRPLSTRGSRRSVFRSPMALAYRSRSYRDSAIP